jgi:hypothetical protein
VDAAKLVLMLANLERNIPAHADQADKIAAHLDAFWTPDMRRQMYARMAADRGSFSQAVQRALDNLHGQAKA